MTEPRLDAALQLARRVVIALAVLWSAALLVVFALRLTFPLELEWMEGGMLHQALRLQEGEAIYPPPGPEFVPFLYTPLYAMVLAALGSVFPLDYALGRAVSIASCVAIAFAIARAIGREGRGRSSRAIGVGLFASSYVFAFRWLDIARPDALAMALTVWGLVLLREAWGDHRKAIVAGLLLAAAFWTKQTAAVFIVASGVGVLWVAPRQAWTYLLTLAVAGGVPLWWGQRVTDGWLWHYIYELHQTHAFNAERFRSKTWGMFLHAHPWLLPAFGAMAWSFARPWLAARRRLDRDQEARLWRLLRSHRGPAYWAWMTGAALLASALGYATQWAEPNAFIPGVVLSSIVVPILLPRGGVKELVGLVSIALQLVFAAVVEPMYAPIQRDGWRAWTASYAWQDLARTIPTAPARERAQRTRAILERADGPVFALQRPWWSVLAGGRGHVGSMGIHDVRPEARARIQDELRTRLRTQPAAQVWFEGEPPEWLVPGLLGYHVVERRSGSARVRPLTGYMSEAGMVTPYREPQLRLEPVAPRLPPAGATVFADFEDGAPQGFVLAGGWGRRPVRAVPRNAPAVGPIGGEYLLSSAGAQGLAGQGTATSPAWQLPHAGTLQLLLGAGPRRDDLSVTLERVDTGATVTLALPAEPFTLRSVRWEIPADWRGVTFRLRLDDRSRRNAVYLDDVWVVPPAAAHAP